MVDAFDDQIEYSSGWSSAGEIGMQTSVQGSFLNFDFVGAFHLELQIFPLTVLILCRYPNNMGNGNPSSDGHTEAVTRVDRTTVYSSGEQGRITGWVQ